MSSKARFGCLIEIALPCRAEPWRLWKLVWAVKRRAGEHLWVLRSVLGSRIDGFFQISKSRNVELIIVGKRALECFGSDADVPPMARTVCDGDLFFDVLGFREKLSHNVEQIFFRLRCNSVSDGKQEPEFLARCINDCGLLACGSAQVIFTGCKWCKVNNGKAHMNDCSPVNFAGSKESMDVLGQPLARSETARPSSRKVEKRSMRSAQTLTTA